jgi:Xaa-Pro aminopeptidase
MNFLARQKKLREQLASSGLDALLVSDLANIRYLCGLSMAKGQAVRIGNVHPFGFVQGRLFAKAAKDRPSALLLGIREST